jgi:hypothetical protein
MSAGVAVCVSAQPSIGRRDGEHDARKGSDRHVWRFGAVVLQPLRVNSFMFESNRNPPYPAGYDYGISRNGAILATAIGVSVDPAAMVLALWDTVESLSKWRQP